MSTARRLVESSGGFWRDIAPLLPSYVKRVNLGGYDRHHSPIRSATLKARHFLVNETAFDALALSATGNKVDLAQVYASVQAKWLRRLPLNESLALDISSEEISEAQELLARLATYRRDYGLKHSVFGALIPAVGRLESVEIDLLSAVAIGEVKSGERPFRSIDFRQLMISALAIRQIDKDHRLLLLNPREGTVWVENTHSLIETACLRSWSEFVHDATFYLSDSGISA